MTESDRIELRRQIVLALIAGSVHVDDFLAVAADLERFILGSDQHETPQ